MDLPRRLRPRDARAARDRMITMSLAGSRSAWSNYTLDGITNTDINFNLYIVLPSVEALQEFKVQTGIYPAEFGRAAGQVNVSTRGREQRIPRLGIRVSAQRQARRPAVFLQGSGESDPDGARKGAVPPESVRLHAGGSGPDPEAVQWQEPPVLHGELRRIQVAHDYDRSSSPR